MDKLAAVLVDLRDDPALSILRSKVGDNGALIKEASVAATSTDYDGLPDEAFALVLVGTGQRLRKYACISPESTLLSTIYFLERQEAIPLSIKKQAAANLVAACTSYNIEVPPVLSKLAEGVEESFSPISLKSAEQELKHLRIQKLAETLKGPKKLKKIAGADDCKGACASFEKKASAMPMKERREAAIQLVTRMQEFGVAPSEFVAKLASNTYSPDLEMGIDVRIAALDNGDVENENHIAAFSRLFEKRAEISPELFAEALAEIDRRAGINYRYSKLPDAYETTFGVIKKASFVWSHGNTRVTEEELGNLAKCPDVLKGHFTEEFVTSFAADPVTIFDSSPLPHKLVMARVAHDALSNQAVAAG